MQCIVDEFCKLVLQGIKEHPDRLLTLREILIKFKEKGIDKDTMLINLEGLRYKCDLESEEDVVLELMDFVAGFCRPDLDVF